VVSYLLLRSLPGQLLLLRLRFIFLVFPYGLATQRRVTFSLSLSNSFLSDSVFGIFKLMSSSTAMSELRESVVITCRSSVRWVTYIALMTASCSALCTVFLVSFSKLLVWCCHRAPITVDKFSTLLDHIWTELSFYRKNFLETFVIYYLSAISVELDVFLEMYVK
jgi:hypothetical protein